MRKTVYKNLDRCNADLTSNEFDRKSTWVAPMLIEYEFYSHRTGEKINPTIIEVSATHTASLKLSLKSALQLLEQRDERCLSFEFDGMKFRINREDNLEDLYNMISEVIDARNHAYAKFADLKNSSTSNV